MNASLASRRYLPIVLPVVAALTAPSAAGAQRPPMPRVRSEPCDGYCQPTWSTCRRAALRAAPDVDARVVARLFSGQLVHVIDGRRITTRPAR